MLIPYFENSLKDSDPITAELRYKGPDSNNTLPTPYFMHVTPIFEGLGVKAKPKIRDLVKL